MDPDSYQKAWHSQSSQTRVTIAADLLLKEVQQHVVVGWPIVADNWSHGLHNQVPNDIAEVSGHGFFGVRRKDGELQLKVQKVVTHKIGDRPAVDVNAPALGEPVEDFFDGQLELARRQPPVVGKNDTVLHDPGGR